MVEPNSPFSLREIRTNIERQDFEAVPDEVVIALVEVAEAAQNVVAETLMCPAGHLDALEVALGKFAENE